MVPAEGWYEMGSQPVEMENEEMTFCELTVGSRLHLDIPAIYGPYGPQDILCKTYPWSWVKSAWSSASSFEKLTSEHPFSYSLSCTFTRQQLRRYRCYVSMVELNQMGRMHQIWIRGKRVEKRKFMGCRVWRKFQGYPRLHFWICSRMNMRCSVEFGKSRTECCYQ